MAMSNGSCEDKELMTREWQWLLVAVCVSAGLKICMETVVYIDIPHQQAR